MKPYIHDANLTASYLYNPPGIRHALRKAFARISPHQKRRYEKKQLRWVSKANVTYIDAVSRS